MKNPFTKEYGTLLSLIPLFEVVWFLTGIDSALFPTPQHAGAPVIPWHFALGRGSLSCKYNSLNSFGSHGPAMFNKERRSHMRDPLRNEKRTERPAAFPFFPFCLFFTYANAAFGPLLTLSPPTFSYTHNARIHEDVIY